MTSPLVCGIAKRFVSVSVALFLVVPSMASAATVELNARDTQTVTRADFLRAAVKASGLSTAGLQAVPYDNVPDALLPYVRAAQAKGALKIFEREGRGLRFTANIRRGEALDIISRLSQTFGSSTSEAAARKYTDAATPATRALIGLAIEKNWLKPLTDTVFGLERYIRGKEATLLLTRAFQLTTPSPSTESQSVPVVRVKLQSIVTQPVPKIDLMESIWNTLRQNFLYHDRIDGDTVGDKAIEAMVNSLGDPYTTYLPKEKNDNFKLQMKGEVEGIGATVEMTGGILTIVSPLRGSPAEKTGLQPKDQILTIDGESLGGFTLDQAVAKIRGPKGTSVRLHINRAGNEFDVTVTREKVVIPEVEIDYRDRGVAVVKILQFWDTTDKKFREAMAEVQKKNPSGIVIDLRNNPGGLLHAAGVVVSNFVPKGSAFVTIMESGSTSEETTDDEPTINATVPMVVLVNKGSASASEIVAGALQDAGRAKIVGETSYGKGTVQQVVQFSDGSSLKYTVAEWRTPKNRPINKIGVAPDIVVKNDGSMPGRDMQMEKALELLR